LPDILVAAADRLRVQTGLGGRPAVEDITLAHHPSSTPRLGPSLSSAAKAAVDEAFRSLMIAWSELPTVAQLHEVKGEVLEAGDLFGARGWLADPASYHRSPPELSSPRVTNASSWGTDYQHLQFVSGYEPNQGEPGRDRWLGYRPPRTAHAWMLRHRDQARPWLVCVHGYRMGFPLADFHAFAAQWLHRDLGLNVIFPVLPLHGQRKVGRRSGDGFFSARFMDTVHAEAQAIWDLRRILSWIRGQGVDDLGIYGVSLGGYTSALLSGLDGDLKCLLAGMPTVCFASLLQRHAPGRLLRMADRIGLGWESVLKVLRVVSPLALASRVPHERRFLYAGASDRLVPHQHVLDLWHHWERPSLRWFEGSHLSFAWERAINELVHRTLATSGLLAPRPAGVGVGRRAA
jgi:hypothetical protein